MKPFLSLLAGVLAAGFIAASAAADPPPGQGNPQHPHKPPGENSLGAGWRQQQDEARQGRVAGRLMPMQSVLDQLRLHTPGHQLDAGLEYEGDRAVYRVRWMTADGRRVDYIVDARTGQVLRGQ